ncbi:hypothetical protein SAMN04244573_03074 [Azotobacter beijerinckii]|uniref:Uncharacterized protein n=1 Tax=Azotobacter beijerinckii TaxID=170623 RepID=A0A1H9M6X8_9GAMM|nr:hypothetical protein [Azotobacter beijerinckii]SER19454.1 hypothetical protein SAMN04244573_03074 [Azotobacter beijerinckii]
MILPDQEQKRRWKALREQIKRSQSESRENRVEKFIAEVEEGYALRTRAVLALLSKPAKGRKGVAA